MRISALLLAASLAAQIGTAAEIGTPAYFAAKEKQLAANPEDLTTRSELAGAYYDYGANRSGLPAQSVRDARRRHLYWFITHHPEAPFLADHRALIAPKGSFLADAEGYTVAARLWREQTSKPGAAAIVIVHAATFFRVADRSVAFALSDRVFPSRQYDPEVATLRASLDILEMLGATAQGNPVEVQSDPKAWDSERGRKARAELDTSQNALLLAAAGHFAARTSVIRCYDFNVGCPNLWASAVPWLERSLQLDPQDAMVKSDLLQVLAMAGTRDPNRKEKVRYFQRALDLSTRDDERGRALLLLANAEFEAGDTQAAERDARRLLELTTQSKDMNPKGPILAGTDMKGFFAMQAHQLLDRIAKQQR